MAVEKRKYERYEIVGAVESKNIRILKGVNVSLSGIRVVTDKEIDSHHILDMAFSMPGITNKFTAEASVVWQKKVELENTFDTGLVFNKLNVDKSKDGVT